VTTVVEFFFDGGGARYVGGPVGWGWVALVDQKEVAVGFGGLPGPSTNNVAEYTGLIQAATHALSANQWPVDVRFCFYGDSALVINQVAGEWRVKAPHLLQYRDEARRLLEPLTYKLGHVRRMYNARADMLATQGRDNYGKSITSRSLFKA